MCNISLFYVGTLKWTDEYHNGPGAFESDQIPVLKSRASTRQFKLLKDDEGSSSHDLQQWLKRKPSVWQSDNLIPLNIDKDQLEEINQILVTSDPQLPDSLVEFSFKDRKYVPVTYHEHNIKLVEIEGTCLHAETPEAKEQLVGFPSATKLEFLTEKESSHNEDDVPQNESLKNGEDEETGDEAEDEELKDGKGDKDDSDQHISSGKTKKLMNQFNFCERATITYENTLKSLGTQTKPPVRNTISDYASQWIIYDSYQKDYELQEKEKEKEKGRKEKCVIATRKDEYSRKVTSEKSDFSNSNLRKKTVILERMINQNMFDDILQDFRYYEDPSDEFRNPEGTLLPLWKFQYQEIKKMCVTDIKWNPRYFDLFAVSFGCFDFQKQSTKGCFCLWSLKNPSFPEYISHPQNGVMTLDFHPSRPYLIVIGMNDGTVAVYDCRLNNKLPIYESSNIGNKHNGTIWQVQWSHDLTEGELTFYSIASDGNILSWILMQNHLCQTLVISLHHRPDAINVPCDKDVQFKDSGTCIAVHPEDNSVFLVGTEEGYIYKCSTAYLSMYLFVYEAHRMPVHRIEYNKYSSNIFASCSADWSIKIWEDSRREPLFVFDVASSVGDIAWAPYSSTVLAAVSQDCKAYVFDLNVDKYKAICVQTVSSRKLSKLTRIAFNWKLPIVIIGDDKGVASVLKLSPNLRIKAKLTKKQLNTDPREVEIFKLEKVLSLIREPTELMKSSVVYTSDSSSF